MPDGTVPVQSLLWALVGDATLALEESGVPSPRFDAEELAGFALGVRRSRLHSVERLDDEALARFHDAIVRRRAREPLQHIIGTASFRYIEVAVGPGVFVPRPETEVVAGWAIQCAQAFAADGPAPVVVDLCTGSGAIAIAVADEVPAATVHAVELSEDALGWARRNVRGTRVQLHGGDAAQALPELLGAVDIVVSNPPYIPADGQIRDPEVLAHDPALALWGQGPDGLDVLRSVAVRAQQLLRAGGWFVVEHADVQGAAVLALLYEQGGWTDVADHTDLAGRDRFATAKRQQSATAKRQQSATAKRQQGATAKRQQGATAKRQQGATARTDRQGVR